VGSGLGGDGSGSIEVDLGGTAGTGELGSFDSSASAAITGVDATTALGTLTPTIQPPSILVDTHDGGDDKRRKKLWEEEQRKKARRREELIAAYEDLFEAKPALAESIVGPYIKPKSRTAIPEVDWEGLLQNLDRVEALYREHREMDDEDVLLLI